MDLIITILPMVTKDLTTVDVPVYRPPVYRFALFTGVFFRATPSPRFTGGMPVYRGGSFFHARGAPPAAAHSHTRCCTQHNITRWVLRAAANTCLHTMPCAAGELCQLSNSTATPELCEVLAHLDIVPGRPAHPAAIEAV